MYSQPITHEQHICDLNQLKERLKQFDEQVTQYLKKCELEQANQNEIINKFKNFETRLNTFDGLCLALNSKQLAQNGLYIAENLNSIFKLKCSHCDYECYIFRTSLRNSHFKSPFDDHKIKSATKCPFVQQPTPSCVALVKSTKPAGQPFNAKYELESSRLNTFKLWPSGLTQTPQDLAECGFYYYGFKDIVRCFHCNIPIHDWQANEQPKVEHARWSPECSFLRRFVGDDFIMDVQKLYANEN